MKIEAIKLPALRNNEYAQFLSDFLDGIHRYDPAVLLLPDEYAALKSHSDTINGALNKATGSTTTDELVKWDASRDDAINGFAASINAHTYSDDADTKAAANVLLNYLSPFGAIARDTYQGETRKLEQIVADGKDKADIKAAVTKLGLGSWLTRIEAANTTFNTLFRDRSINAGIADEAQEKVYDKRPEINEAYYELRNQLESWYNVKKKAAPWSTAIAAVNGIIRIYNDLIARRGTEDGDGTGNTDTPPAS